MMILYFAWLREKTGVAQEEVSVPAEVGDVRGLIAWIEGRGGGFAEAMSDPSIVRVAVNQEAVPLDHPVGADDEVAFFPPMTGGRR